MNLRNINLNLLVIFDAIIAERSITGAARAVGMSQSAVSHALVRLRQMFKDDLVRRTSHGMEPTARALKISRSVQAALRQIETAVEEQIHFDPKTSTHIPHPRFRLPGRLSAAPAVRPHSRRGAVCYLERSHPASPNGSHVDPDVDDQLFVCRRDAPKPGVRRERLFEEPLPIVKHTDLCAILPKAWLRLYGAPQDFATAPVPLPEMEFTVDQFSDPSRDEDPGHRWLRRLIQEEMRALQRPDGGSLH